MRQKSSGYTYDTFAWQGFNKMKTQAQPGKGLLVTFGGEKKRAGIEMFATEPITAWFNFN